MMSYSKRHFERLSNGPPDTATTIAYRLADRKAREQAHAEMSARWPTLTAENAREAIAWMETRIRKLLPQVDEVRS